MSDSTPILTPTRTAKDIVNCFEVENNLNEEEKGISEHINTENGFESKQSYQEWRDTLMDEKKSSNSKKSSKNSKKNKKKTNIELLTGMTQSNILKSAKKPVLSQAKSVTTPLNGGRSKNFAQTTKKKAKVPLEKVFSEDPKCADYDNLAISTGSNEEHDHTVPNRSNAFNNSERNFNYDLIQEVDQGKKDIREKKKKLKDLEEEIVTISDKMTSYQNETDEIISDLQERIREREDLNQKIKEEPMIYTLEGNQIDTNQESQSHDDYTSEDDLLNLLKSGVDQKFKTFLDSCKGDLKSWKSVVAREVEAFNEFLQHKHKVLQKDMADEISNFTPVLSGKFEVK